jgi:hypothetical protein
VTRSTRLLVGGLTVAMATGFGATFLVEGRYLLAAVLWALALLRAILLFRDWRSTPAG